MADRVCTYPVDWQAVDPFRGIIVPLQMIGESCANYNSPRPFSPVSSLSFGDRLVRLITPDMAQKSTHRGTLAKYQLHPRQSKCFRPRSSFWLLLGLDGARNETGRGYMVRRPVGRPKVSSRSPWVESDPSLWKKFLPSFFSFLSYGVFGRVLLLFVEQKEQAGGICFIPAKQTSGTTDRDEKNNFAAIAYLATAQGMMHDNLTGGVHGCVYSWDDNMELWALIARWLLLLGNTRRRGRP